MEYVNGEDATNNKHLAEAIDMTREGSAQPGATEYDDPDRGSPEMTLRDQCFRIAIEELEKIDSAPEESQEEIDSVLRMLQNAENAGNQRRSQAMAKAHETLQDVWVPPK